MENVACSACNLAQEMSDIRIEAISADVPTKNFMKFYSGILKEVQGTRQHCYKTDF